MQGTERDADPMPEVVVYITWREGTDGQWEAWVEDESGGASQRVRSEAELARFLKQVCGRDAPGFRGSGER